ncbi:hypothetical protein T484DRAFT_1860268 [Baffinella frigidus]|nr:hypothetical protein T484DRAFT_1860268 [Cryptophyta sp. CCMP2293]
MSNQVLEMSQTKRASDAAHVLEMSEMSKQLEMSSLEMSRGKKAAETVLEKEKSQAGERAAADKKVMKRTSKELRASRTQGERLHEDLEATEKMVANIAKAHLATAQQALLKATEKMVANIAKAHLATAQQAR